MGVPPFGGELLGEVVGHPLHSAKTRDGQNEADVLFGGGREGIDHSAAKSGTNIEIEGMWRRHAQLSPNPGPLTGCAIGRDAPRSYPQQEIERGASFFRPLKPRGARHAKGPGEHFHIFGWSDDPLYP